ncbi:Hypothetical predicted protein, partial [Olea europaea subsp. europaea]
MDAVVADTSAMAEHTKYRKPRNQNHLPSSSTITAAAKKKIFTAATFRGLGCTSSSTVSVPAVIRTSANWNANKVKRIKPLALSSNCGGVPDVLCGPGIGLNGVAAPVNCVVSKRPAVSSRSKADGADRIIHSQRE